MLCPVGCFGYRYLQWASGLSLTIAGRYNTWDKPLSPRIRHISTTGGCGNVQMSGNVTLTGCQGGELLQLYGTNFLTVPFIMAALPTSANSDNIVYYGYTALCEQLAIVSDSYATCILPSMQDYPDMQYDTQYMMLLWNSTDNMRSNALFFTFASSDSVVVRNTSSSSNLALLVALPVVLAVLGVVLAAVTVRQLRAKARSTPGGRSAESSNVYAEEKEAKQKQAKRGGGWWQSKAGPTLASFDEVRAVELT